MKTFKLVLLSALIGASGLASAAYDGSRDDRMQSALDDYHNSSQYKATQGDSSSRSSGGVGASIKHGAQKVGTSVKHGAEKVGHAVGTGLHKTGEAIDHAGQKLKSKTAD